jgi:hypothetical protein
MTSAIILARLRDLFGALRTSDGDTRPTPYAVASTQASHGWIAAWTTLGALALGAPPWLAVTLTIGAWGGVWEAAQYLRTPTTRVRRDWLLGDLPAYTTGAGTVAFVVGDAVAGQWAAWLLATPFVALGPIFAAAIFGRTRDE